MNEITYMIKSNTSIHKFIQIKRFIQIPKFIKQGFENILNLLRQQINP